MEISIIVPTCRVGGVDVVCAGFGRDYQTYRGDYEVILVDSLFDWRKNEVKSYAELTSCPLKHVPQMPNKPSVSIPHNNGLRLAEGEIVIHTVDYTFPKPTFLEDAVSLYHAYPKHVFSGFRDIREMPYKQSLYNYIEECNAIGRENVVITDDLKISVFSAPLSADVSAYPVTEHRETPDGYAPPDWTYLTPSVFPRQELLDIGGFDERLLGSGGYADCDVGMRFGRMGYRHLMSPKLHVSLLRGNIPFPDPSRNRREDDAFNHAIYEQHNRDGVIYVDNGWVV